MGAITNRYPHHCVGRYPKINKQTHKNNSFWVFQNKFLNFYEIFGFLCQHTIKCTKTVLKTLNPQQQGTTLKVMGDKIPRICINNT